MEIKAVYDQLISTQVEDPLTHKIVRMVENHHFVFGKVGDEVCGGVYIRRGIPLPETITIKLPKPEVE